MSRLQTIALSCAALLLVSCEQAPQIQQLTGPAQGTSYHISYWSPNDAKVADLQQQITTELDRVDRAMSNYRADSTIEQFNSQQSSEPQQVGRELVDMVEAARTVTQASAGCYDLTVKPFFELWGFRQDKFNRPSADEISQTQQLVGMDKISSTADGTLQKSNPAMRIDLSSIAQGYTVGRLAQILEQNGINNYLVELGGELMVRGKKPAAQAWRVAIEKPLPDNQQLQKIVTVLGDEPLSIMSSGTYRHYFDENGQRYSHVLDARKGAPVTHHTVATTVLIADPSLGDAWSTAFLCLGSEQGLKVADELGLQVLFIDQNGDELTEIASKALAQNKTVELKTP